MNNDASEMSDANRALDAAERAWLNRINRYVPADMPRPQSLEEQIETWRIAAGLPPVADHAAALARVRRAILGEPEPGT